MQIVKTTLTAAHIKMTLANLDEAAPSEERMSFRLALPAPPAYDDSMKAIQLAALRRAQDVIVGEIRRLSGR